MARYFIHAQSVFHLRKDHRPGASHSMGIALHHAQIRPDGWCQVGLINNQQVRLRDARAAFARNLVTARNVNDVNSKVR
jgi:hypothetical protein